MSWIYNPFTGKLDYYDPDTTLGAHHETHENGGDDELSVDGLSGDLADAQDPKAHASDHVDGTDDIQSATAVQKGLATAAQITKLDGIEALADVTANHTCDTPGGAGTDTTAIHDNTSGEISAVTEKASPVSADLVLIEDSESSNAKKRAQIGNFPAGGQEILGDGTTGRVLRGSYITIQDGTNASTLKCTLTSRWNGDAIAVTDNIAKDATTGNFALSANGAELKILASGLSGNAIFAWSMFLANSTSTEFLQQVNVSGNDLRVAFRYFSGGLYLYDITALVDTGDIYVELIYLTDA